MEILLVRHGRTEGNLQRRYVGRTDEPLCRESVRKLQESKYRNFRPELVYSSRLFRCVQTARILFPDQEIQIREGLEEMDFGEFEYRTYEDLKEDARYCAWIDSGGMAQCPGGESGDDFRKRCAKAFLSCVRDAADRGAYRIAVVAHGGTVMAVMERFASPRRDYYSWQPACGSGYLLEFEPEILEALRQGDCNCRGTVLK